EQVAASRAVLRRYGNVSSATILFVLDELRRTFSASSNGNGSHAQRQTGVAMAFGPGLVIEMARLTYVPALAKRLPTAFALAPHLALLEPA
ncbi:MAG: hypothetical protein M3Q45_13210, partial [Chloroflexota bacterium]|nr:hypothetical protein [Chloroflexota bacterium]